MRNVVQNMGFVVTRINQFFLHVGKTHGRSPKTGRSFGMNIAMCCMTIHAVCIVPIFMRRCIFGARYEGHDERSLLLTGAYIRFPFLLRNIRVLPVS